ncbi:venom protein 302-like [Haliotis rubra]|uniref:venom protein 302-like n=1 Tax=Haliotis rubra TaxID=36100 RepID=UPI001EE53631|nr:venom protein 302-like [Haliotis rubra]
MSRIFLMVGIILGVVFVDLSNGLSCLLCDESKCVSPKCKPKHQIKDLCGCCDICGGRVGDSCSGFNQCANGLWCIAVKGNEAQAKRKMIWHDQLEGVCGILRTDRRDTKG